MKDKTKKPGKLLPYKKPKMKFFGKLKGLTLGGLTGITESGGPIGSKMV